jgi:hypothetical protein
MLIGKTVYLHMNNGLLYLHCMCVVKVLALFTLIPTSSMFFRVFLSLQSLLHASPLKFWYEMTDLHLIYSTCFFSRQSRCNLVEDKSGLGGVVACCQFFLRTFTVFGSVYDQASSCWRLGPFCSVLGHFVDFCMWSFNTVRSRCSSIW